MHKYFHRFWQRGHVTSQWCHNWGSLAEHWGWEATEHNSMLSFWTFHSKRFSRVFLKAQLIKSGFLHEFFLNSFLVVLTKDCAATWGSVVLLNMIHQHDKLLKVLICCCIRIDECFVLEHVMFGSDRIQCVRAWRKPWSHNINCLTYKGWF